MALRTGTKLSIGPAELLKWTKNLNLGLHMENWRIHTFRNEISGGRLILYVDLGCADTIKQTG
jgi:hypothetical protein